MMAAHSLPERYSPIQAWLHDYLIAERALNLHAYLLDTTGLSAILSEPRSRTLLDVGSGGGQSAMRLKRVYPHLTITGVDLSEDQIARARRRAQRAGVDVCFEVADAQALPFADASFDVVFSFGSAKHWPDPAGASTSTGGCSGRAENCSWPMRRRTRRGRRWPTSTTWRASRERSEERSHPGSTRGCSAPPGRCRPTSRLPLSLGCRQGPSAIRRPFRPSSFGRESRKRRQCASAPVRQCATEPVRVQGCRQL
jgi:SAM-dependent methyltransferase